MKICFGQFFLKRSSRRAEADATKQTVLSFQEVAVGHKRKVVIKSNLPSLSLQTAKFFLFKRVSKTNQRFKSVRTEARHRQNVLLH